MTVSLWIVLALSTFWQSDLLKLDFDAFDQDASGGWRALANEGHSLEAARLIDRYVEVNRKRLSTDQLKILNFHSGQNYAFADRYGLAIRRFKVSYQRYSDDLEDEFNGFVSSWNAYVDATIAFLEGDLGALLRQREIIREGVSFEGKKPNLNIVNGFVRNFGKPYSKAYGQ